MLNNDEYEKNILKWRQEVDGNLRRENGWLALAGLFWLRKGTNDIGSAPNSDILLPSRAPEKLGTFVFDGNGVILNVELDTPVEVNGVQTKIARLDTDEEDVPSFITFFPGRFRRLASFNKTAAWVRRISSISSAARKRKTERRPRYPTSPNGAIARN